MDVRVTEKINCPILLVFWPGYGVASMVPYNQYETINAPCIRTKIRRSIRPIYFFRDPKAVSGIYL